jgi:hypothetical protein
MHVAMADLVRRLRSRTIHLGMRSHLPYHAIPSALSRDPICPITRSHLPYHAIPSALSRDPICPITRSHLPYHAIPSALSRDPICPITRSHLPYHAIPSALSRDPICPITRSHLPYHAIPSALSRDPICPITRSHLSYHAIRVASSARMPRNHAKCIVTAMAGMGGTSFIHCRMALGLDAPEQTVFPGPPLSANVRETDARTKFSVEGEQAKAARERIIESSPHFPALPHGSDVQGCQAAIQRRVQEPSLPTCVRQTPARSLV